MSAPCGCCAECPLDCLAVLPRYLVDGEQQENLVPAQGLAGLHAVGCGAPWGVLSIALLDMQPCAGWMCVQHRSLQEHRTALEEAAFKSNQTNQPTNQPTKSTSHTSQATSQPI